MNRILVIDNDFAIGRTLQLHLSNEGFHVIHLQSAEEGLNKLKTINPNLILLDLRLGGMKGLNSLPLFKEKAPKARIFVMTTPHDVENTATAMQRGADEYLHKPLDLDELDVAVNKTLACQNKRLREDLNYRLPVVPIAAPALRERKEDLEELIRNVLSRANRDLGRQITAIAPDVMEALSHYHWPGNVRELENTLIKAVALCQGDMLTMDLLPEHVLGNAYKKEGIGKNHSQWNV